MAERYKHHAFKPAVYWPFAVCKFQEYLAYRSNVFMFMFGDALKIVCMFFLWRAIFAGSGEGTLNGFNFPDMITYILLSISTGCCVPHDEGQIITEIKNGSIVMSLAKPISYRLKTYFSSLGDTLYTMIFMMLPCLAATVIVNKIYGNMDVYSVSGTFLFLISLCFSVYINMCMRFLIGCMTFVTLNIWGVRQIFDAIHQLLSGVLIPLAFFPSWAKGIVELLPFASIISTPVNLFLGTFTTEGIVRAIAVQVAWAVIFSGLTEIVWRAVVKRLVVQGG